MEVPAAMVKEARAVCLRKSLRVYRFMVSSLYVRMHDSIPRFSSRSTSFMHGNRVQFSVVQERLPGQPDRINLRTQGENMEPVIDRNLCNGCNLCVRDCPKRVLGLDEEKKAYIIREGCIECSHCYAICPEEAVSYPALEGPSFETFEYRERLTGGEEISPADLCNLVRSRRSIRNYRDREVDRETLLDLVEAARQAPSGSNDQQWHFTIIPTRLEVEKLAGGIRSFFEKINGLASNPLIRYGSIPFMGKALVTYYREYMPTVLEAMRDAGAGDDRLFHGAPALVMIHAPRSGSTPREDAQYAGYIMTLLAHTLGLGSCFIGYAVEAMNREPSLKRMVDIPAGHRVDTVLALGHPSVSYRRPALRKPASVRIHS
jgi:nitroreductase/NAD-dependent dihydropyrimidine dehydrogenase PreA subunit